MSVEGIGDLTSAARGSGARANGGKPDLSLLPLCELAEHMRSFAPDTPDMTAAVAAMHALGQFQASHSVQWLHAALHLLGDEAIEECAQVFDYGRRKYAAWNWAKGMPWSVPLACGARHLFAILRGEASDLESGKTHRGHAACNIVMLITFARTYPEGNDLPPEGLL